MPITSLKNYYFIELDNRITADVSAKELGAPQKDAHLNNLNVPVLQILKKDFKSIKKNSTRAGNRKLRPIQKVDHTKASEDVAFVTEVPPKKKVPMTAEKRQRLAKTFSNSNKSSQADNSNC